MNDAIDLTGMTFGALTVIGRAGTQHPPVGRRGHRIALWECRCSCGRRVVVKGWALRNASRTTCWGQSHRMSAGKRLSYATWAKMIARCNDPADPAYANYGGRGISVCATWCSFSAFYADMGDRPGRGYSIERTDVNGNYGPDNCRWATAKEQARNKRDTLYVEYGGSRHKLIELCEVNGWDYRLVLKRLNLGWSIERAINTPRAARRKTLRPDPSRD